MGVAKRFGKSGWNFTCLLYAGRTIYTTPHLNTKIKTKTKEAGVDSHVYASNDFCDHRGMQLVFLGTSSSKPTITRNPSCIALRLDGTVYLFDCGEGVQKQLNWIPFRQISFDKIFISHMHGDHIFGLPGLLSGLGMANFTKQLPLTIYGPKGLRSWIRSTLKACYGRVPPKYRVHELLLEKEKGARQQADDILHCDELPGKNFYSSEDGLWHILRDQKYTVKAGLLKHSIPCWGFVVEEEARPGRFDVERASQAGVKPGRDYDLLQAGCSITLRNGRQVYPSEVLGPPRRGRKLVILGDTYDPSSLQGVAQGADLLVHECTILEEDAAEAVHRAHSTASMAGRFAKKINVHCLVLTHFSGKYEGRPELIQNSVHAASITFGKDHVVAARDRLAITVRQTDEPA